MTWWELLGIAAALGGLRWLARAIFKPKRTCRWCKGSGRNWWSDEERSGDCWFCHGTPRRMTWGARLVRGEVGPFRGDRWGK